MVVKGVLAIDSSSDLTADNWLSREIWLFTVVVILLLTAGYRDLAIDSSSDLAIDNWLSREIWRLTVVVILLLTTGCKQRFGY